MKSVLKSFAIAVAISVSGANFALADDAVDAASLDLDVTGLAPLSGQLMVAVYTSEADWNQNNAFRAARVDVDSGTLMLAFEGLAPGSYGIKMFHDVDADGVMGTNLMGIPTEPFAFSNNARGSFGPATWSDANFAIAEGENRHAISFQ
jgi:uncharacterized protein (DUF2141 family)